MGKIAQYANIVLENAGMSITLFVIAAILFVILWASA